MGDGYFALHSVFWLRGLNVNVLTTDNRNKEGIEYLSFFLILRGNIPCHIQLRMIILLTLPFVANVFVKTFFQYLLEQCPDEVLAGLLPLGFSPCIS